jgi:hypothetical protein
LGYEPYGSIQEFYHFYHRAPARFHKNTCTARKVSDDQQKYSAEGSKEHTVIKKWLMNTDVSALKSQYYFNIITGYV